MATPQTPPETTHTPSPEELAAKREQEIQTKRTMIGVIIGVIVVLALLGIAIYFLLSPNTSSEWVGKLRDVFIIVVAFESLLIGVAMIVLVIQLANLINLLQNEVKPILQATTDTVNNLRGTAEFLGENVVEPVIKLNRYLAGLYRMLELMGVKKK